MSKKKEINLKSTPAAVESGDVNISYNNVLVGSLSDSGSAVLKTEMTICEHDIELEYTKPAAGITLPEIILTKPADNPLIPEQHDTGVILYDTPNGILANSYSFVTGSKIYAVPRYILGTYKLNIFLESRGDSYNVTINNTSVPFADDGYYYTYSSATYPEEITIVITNKE